MNIRMYFEIIKLNINLVVTICTTTFNIETLYVLLTQFTVNSQLPDVTGGIGREGGGVGKVGETDDSSACLSAASPITCLIRRYEFGNVNSRMKAIF